MEETLLVEVARIANNLQRIATQLGDLTNAVERIEDKGSWKVER